MLIDHDLPLAAEIDKLGRRGTPERDIQRAAVRWLRTVLPGAVVAAVVNEQRGTGRTVQERMRFGQARKASGVVSGFPDLIVVMQGRTLFVEMKAPGGVVSEDQQRIHADFAQLGHPVIVADSIEALRLGLHRAGIATRETPGQPMREAKVRRERVKLPSDDLPF